MSLLLDLNDDEERAVEAARAQSCWTDFEIMRLLWVRRHQFDARYNEDWGAQPRLSFIRWMIRHGNISEYA